MELLLNILWLALALPAFWVWRQKSGCHLTRQRFRCSGPLLLLGCVLLLLFPVVSATDDLYAMRPEMEESNAFSSVHKQSGGSRAALATHSAGNFLAHFISSSLRHNDEVCALVFLFAVRVPESVPFSQQVSRAPPSSALS